MTQTAPEKATAPKTRDYVCTVNGLTLATGQKNAHGKQIVLKLRLGDTVTVDARTAHMIRVHREAGSLVPAEKWNGKRKTAHALWKEAKAEDDSVANLTAEALHVPVDGTIPSIGEFLKANPNGDGGVDVSGRGGVGTDNVDSARLIEE